MAYGQFLDYQPVPDIPGAYNFQTAGGKALTFGGPEAEQLKARLDAAKSATMVAGDKAAPGLPAAPTQTVSITKDAPETTMALAQPPADKPLIENEVNTGWTLDAQGNPYRMGGGSRGVSQAQLQQKAQTGTALPTGQSESVTGGFERSPEYEEQIANARIDMKLASEQGREAELKAYEEGRKVEQEQFAAATGQRDEALALQNKIQAQVDQAQAVRDQALKEYTGSSVDPNRIFHGPAGGLKAIGAAIAAGAGAYGAAINHTQNFAQQVIDNAIARDINAQEADIRIKKDKSDTALGDLIRRGMSLEQAKGTLATIQKDWARQQTLLAKGASGSDEINARHDALLAKWDMDAANDAEQYRQKSLGTATKAIQAQIAYPVAPTAGGRIYATPGERRQIISEKTSTEASAANTGKTFADIKKTQTETGKAPEMRPLETEKADKIAAMSQGIAAGAALLKELPAGDSEIDDPTKGPLDWLNFQKTHRLTELTGALAKGAQASRGKSDKDAELAERDVAGSGTLSARRRLAQEQIAAQKNALIQQLAGMSPEQRAEQIKAFPPEVQEVLRGTR